jgi:hypothetical protein
MIFKSHFQFGLLFILLFSSSVLYAQSLTQYNLPILVIIIYVGINIKDEHKVPSEMLLFDKGPGLINSLSDIPKHKFIAGIEFRGSTSQGGPNFYFLPNILVKMPYSFVIWTDTTRLSTYFYKERDSKGGKIKMGPVWDYNLSFGNADYYNGNNSSGWIFNIVNDIPDNLHLDSMS